MSEEQKKETTAESMVRNCKHGKPCTPVKLNDLGAILPTPTCGLCARADAPIAFAPGDAPVMPERQSTEVLLSYTQSQAVSESKAVGYDLDKDKVRKSCRRHDWFSEEGTPCPKCDTETTKLPLIDGVTESRMFTLVKVHREPRDCKDTFLCLPEVNPSHFVEKQIPVYIKPFRPDPESIGGGL